MQTRSFQSLGGLRPLSLAYSLRPNTFAPALPHPLPRFIRIGASEYANETAVPEGRQAQWNGARLPMAN